MCIYNILNFYTLGGVVGIVGDVGGDGREMFGSRCTLQTLYCTFSIILHVAGEKEEGDRRGKEKKMRKKKEESKATNL